MRTFEEFCKTKNSIIIDKSVEYEHIETDQLVEDLKEWETRLLERLINENRFDSFQERLYSLQENQYNKDYILQLIKAKELNINL